MTLDDLELLSSNFLGILRCLVIIRDAIVKSVSSLYFSNTKYRVESQRSVIVGEI